MTKREALVSLRIILTKLYDTAEDARRIAADAGLELSAIPYNATLLTYWQNILNEANRRNRVEHLISAASSGYPEHAENLRQAQLAYLAASDDDERRAPAWTKMARPAPFMAEAPPLDFVQRPHEFNTLIDLLLASDQTHSIAITAALRGAGGYGKTTLTQAICHDPRIREAYKDGILWVRLGETPGDLLGRVLDLVEALTGHRPQFRTLETAQARLAEELSDRQMLLVIDDIWDAAHLRPFLQGGPACTHLLTTRNDQVIPANSKKVNVDAMTMSEAVALLRTNLPDGEENVLTALTIRLGEWPLLIKLVNGALRQFVELGEPLVTALADVNAALSEAGLTVFDDPSDQTARERAVAATLNASLRCLSTNERPLYEQLAIFPEDSDIPLVTVARLWQRNIVTTKLLCTRLANLSLLQHLDLATNTLRLHDVVRVYLRQQVVDLVALNRRFLDCYELTDWCALPFCEPYLWIWLAYHLLEADRDTDLVALFANHHWLHVRVTQAAYVYDGYLADLMLVWQHADAESRRQIEADQPPASFAACVRYALIRTSINTLAANHIPALVARAVETGLWSPVRALSIASTVPDAYRRAEMYRDLLKTPTLDKHQRQLAQSAALAATVMIKDVWNRIDAIGSIGTQLTGGQREEVLAQGLQLTLAIEDEDYRAEAIALLAPQLNGTMLMQGLQAALDITDEWSRAKVLVMLVPQLTGVLREHALRQALQAILVIEVERKRAKLLAKLAPQLTGTLLDTGLQAALVIKDEWNRAYVLAALVPQLSGTLREEILMQKSQLALAIKGEVDRAYELTVLVPQLTGIVQEDTLAQGLQATLAIEDVWSRIRLLASLAPHLSEEAQRQILPQSLQEALTIQDVWDRARLLTLLAPQLSGELQEEALMAGLRTALTIGSERDRAYAVALLAPHLSKALLVQSLQKALVIDDKKDLTYALATLGLHVGQELREETLVQGLQTALTVEDELFRSEVLAISAPEVSKEIREERLVQALQTGLAIRDEWKRTRALMVLASQLTGPLLSQGLQATLTIGHEWNRAVALSAFLPQVVDPSSIFHPLRQAMLDNLWRNLQGLKREALLRFLADETLFCPPILDTETLAAIAASLIEICNEWQWI